MRRYLDGLTALHDHALIAEMARDRLFIAEDVPELRCTSPNRVQYHVQPPFTMRISTCCACDTVGDATVTVTAARSANSAIFSFRDNDMKCLSCDEPRSERTGLEGARQGCL